MISIGWQPAGPDPSGHTLSVIIWHFLLDPHIQMQKITFGVPLKSCSKGSHVVLPLVTHELLHITWGTNRVSFGLGSTKGGAVVSTVASGQRRSKNCAWDPSSEAWSACVCMGPLKLSSCKSHFSGDFWNLCSANSQYQPASKDPTSSFLMLLMVQQGAYQLPSWAQEWADLPKTYHW